MIVISIFKLNIPYHVMIATGPLNAETGNIARHKAALLTENPVNFPDLP